MTAPLWHWRPDPEIVERLEWSTEVLRSRAWTQRISRRAYPRIILRHKYIMTRQDAHRAALLARSVKTVLVPLWQDGARTSSPADEVGDVIVGQIEFFQETNVGKRFNPDDGLVAIIGDVGSHEVLTVDYVTWINSFARVETLTGATQAHPRAIIAPIVEASVEFRITRVSGDYVQALAEFISTQSTEIIANFPNAEIATYRGDWLMTFRPLADIEEPTGREWRDIDADAGLIARTEAYTYPVSTSTMRWYLDRWDTVGRGRWWVYELQGRQKQFWLPTFNEDFIATATLSGTTLYVEDVGYTDAQGTGHIAILGDDGLWYPREVTASAVVTPGVEEALQVDSDLPDVEPVMICQLRLMRQASDTVEFKYLGPGFGGHPNDPLLGAAILSLSVTEDAPEYVPA